MKCSLTLILLAVCLSIAYGQILQPAGVRLLGTPGTDDEYDPNPQYQYSYQISDPTTGDAKSQEETRNGDTVRGSYSLVEADGSIRVVQYTADPINGFNAVVSRQ